MLSTSFAFGALLLAQLGAQPITQPSAPATASRAVPPGSSFQVGTPNPIISEICDGPLTGGQPKWVQINNPGTVTIPDLSIYSIGQFAGGNTTLGGGEALQLLPRPLGPGESYIVAYEFTGTVACDRDGALSCFEFVYGTQPDQSHGPFINGDDSVVLYRGFAVGDGSNAEVIDRYGEPGVDGTGEVWEYTDSYARRCTATPSPTFNPNEWLFAGPDDLEDPFSNNNIELALLRWRTSPFLVDLCPNGPELYCAGKFSSAACQTRLTVQAPNQFPVSGALDYSVSAVNVQGFKTGIFFGGIAGRALVPFNGGVLCVQPPLIRTPPQNSVGTSPVSCDGGVQLLINTGIIVPFGTDPGSGNTLNLQLWYRDPTNGMANFGSALSDALEIPFL